MVKITYSLSFPFSLMFHYFWPRKSQKNGEDHRSKKFSFSLPERFIGYPKFSTSHSYFNSPPLISFPILLSLFLNTLNEIYIFNHSLRLLYLCSIWMNFLACGLRILFRKFVGHGECNDRDRHRAGI